MCSSIHWAIFSTTWLKVSVMLIDLSRYTPDFYLQQTVGFQLQVRIERPFFTSIYMSEKGGVA